MGSISVNALEVVFLLIIGAVVIIPVISTLYINKNLISASFWDFAGLGIIFLYIAVTFIFAYYKIRRS